MPADRRLSEKSALVLSLIAQGYSYSQIVDGQPEISYLDIFGAAREALSLTGLPSRFQERMNQIRSRYARAYQPWSEGELERLALLHEQGVAAEEIARILERQPSAVTSRLARLGLRA